MRGQEETQGALFSYVNIESRIPETHPLRILRGLVDKALEGLHDDFEEMYSKTGRPSIPPERLLKALIIQVLYSVRSERLLMEELNYNLLYRWFVGLGMDDPVWAPTTFTKNRERLLEQKISKRFFEEVLSQAEASRLLSSEHFTVDGSFIEAWASQKSFQKKDQNDDSNDPPQSGGGRNPSVNFHGEKRRNKTHESKTDPEARMMRKGNTGAKLVHHGHVMTENRNGLVMATEVTISTGTCEIEAASRLIQERPTEGKATVGGDKLYDNATFVKNARACGVTPHVAKNEYGNVSSNIDDRTIRHKGYEMSQRRRKMVEEVFGWMKTVGLMRKTRHRGTRLVGWMFEFTAAIYNLVRMKNLGVAA